MSKTQIARVRAACPIAKFDLDANTRDLGPSLKVLGDKQDTFEVFTDQSPGESENGPAECCACSNIQIVKLHHRVIDADITCFNKTPKYLLKTIQLRTACTGAHLQNIVSLITSGTGALETINNTCLESPIGMFNELVQNNKLLKDVKIYFFDIFSGMCGNTWKYSENAKFTNYMKKRILKHR